MSVQTQIDRISTEVDTQADLISQIKTELENVSPSSTLSAYGKPNLTVTVGSDKLTEETINSNLSVYKVAISDGTYTLSWDNKSKQVTVSGSTSTALLLDTISSNDWEDIEWASKYYKIPDTWSIGDTAPNVTISGTAYPTRVIDIGHEGKGSITFEFQNAIGSAVYGFNYATKSEIVTGYEGDLPDSVVMELPKDTELGAYTSSTQTSFPYNSGGTIYAYYGLNSQTTVLKKTLKGSTTAVRWWIYGWSSTASGSSTQNIQAAIQTTGYGSTTVYSVTYSGGSSNSNSGYISPIFYFA